MEAISLTNRNTGKCPLNPDIKLAADSSVVIVMIVLREYESSYKLRGHVF